MLSHAAWGAGLLAVLLGAGCSGKCRSPSSATVEGVIPARVPTGDGAEDWYLSLELEGGGLARPVLLFVDQRHRAEYLYRVDYSGVIWRLLGRWEGDRAGVMNMLFDWVQVHKGGRVVGAWQPDAPYVLRLMNVRERYDVHEDSTLLDSGVFVKSRIRLSPNVLFRRSSPVPLERAEWRTIGGRAF